MTKKERISYLLNCVANWQRQGMTEMEAISKLSLKQYDFLIDCGIDFQSMQLSENQQLAVSAITRNPRPVFPNGYQKRYPKGKQDVYSSIVKCLEEMGASVNAPEKCNYRDIEFSISDVTYKLILSIPRTKKED